MVILLCCWTMQKQIPFISCFIKEIRKKKDSRLYYQDIILNTTEIKSSRDSLSYNSFKNNLSFPKIKLHKICRIILSLTAGTPAMQIWGLYILWYHLRMRKFKSRSWIDYWTNHLNFHSASLYFVVFSILHSQDPLFSSTLKILVF